MKEKLKRKLFWVCYGIEQIMDDKFGTGAILNISVFAFVSWAIILKCHIFPLTVIKELGIGFWPLEIAALIMLIPINIIHIWFKKKTSLFIRVTSCKVDDRHTIFLVATGIALKKWNEDREDAEQRLLNILNHRLQKQIESCNGDTPYCNILCEKMAEDIKKNIPDLFIKRLEIEHYEFIAKSSKKIDGALIFPVRN